MSNQLLASKIVIVEEEPKIRTIAGITTSVTAVLGITEKGPVGVPTLVNSVADYDRIFGGYSANGDVRQAIDGFFQNGGTDAYVCRVVHYTDVTTPATKTSLQATIALQNATPAPTLTAKGKWDGTYAHVLKIRIDDATSGEVARFNLSVLKNGLLIEVFPNVSMDDADPRYVETIVNDLVTGSAYIVVTDMDVAPSTPATERPVNVTSAFLAGGNDGLTGIVDVDFSGADGATGKTGMRAFDTVPDLNLLIVPGRATAPVQNAMISYCEVTRSMSMFAILDPPSATTAVSIITYYETTAAVLGLSEFAAAYWPRVKVLNPSKTIFGNVDQIVVAPSGHVAGVYARTDAARQGGVYDPPAGIEKGILVGVLGFETLETLDENKRDLVFPKRINPLTTGRGMPRFIDGSRTLKGNGNFPSVSERRGAIYIEQSVKDGLQYARHKRNTEELRRSVERTASAFLQVQMKNGAFRSNDPATAYFVDFSDDLNPASVQFAGQLVGRIGIATAKPAEYIVLRFSQDTRALEEEAAA